MSALKTPGMQAPPWLERYLRLGDAGAVELPAAEAMTVLGDLSRDLARVSDPVLAQRLMLVGRKLAGAEIAELLLDAATQPLSDPALIAGALRFRGTSAVGAVLGRLHSAQERSARRPYFQLATTLASFPELRDSMVGSLEVALFDQRWEVARNAIALLAAIGAPMPPETHGDLASSPHVPVRLAFTQVVARWKPCPAGLDLLCALIRDDHAGIRLAAAVALRQYPDARARRALEHCAAHERDAETRAVCEGALRKLEPKAEARVA